MVRWFAVLLFLVAGSAPQPAEAMTYEKLKSYFKGVRKGFAQRMLAAALLLIAHPAVAESINPAGGQFVASRTWFQLGDDKEKLLFRSYALLVKDGKPIDSPNLFVMSCPREGQPYITLHFPPNYLFQGFGPDTWLPKTDLALRNAGGTFSFVAELNSNEFHIDLGETEFDYLHEIWAADGPVDLKLGPAQTDVALIFAPIEDLTRSMLAEAGRQLTAQYAFLEMRTRCLASAVEASQDWKIFGSINCPDCEKSDGKTFTFITMDRREGGDAMRSAEECNRARQALLTILQKENTKGQTMVADLLCIGDGG